MHVELQKVDPAERGTFQEMAEAYWRELMPHSPIVTDPARRDKYFAERFRWRGVSEHPYWVVADGDRVGFLMFRVSDDGNFAQVHDLFIVEQRRREGIGSTAVQDLLARLAEMGVNQIDLNVRADNPTALEFWRAQGFNIALHCLRLYSDSGDHGGA